MYSPRVSHLDEIRHPKIRHIAKRVLRTAQLAAEKAALHQSDPKKYPLGTAAQGYSLERIFLQRLRSLPPVKRDFAVRKSVIAANSKSAIRKRYYGDFSFVEAKRKVPIRKQAESLKYPARMRFSKDEFFKEIANLDMAQLVRVAPYSLSDLAPPSVEDVAKYYEPSDLVRQNLPNVLDFRINRVWCIDETSGFLGSEAGKDEIQLAGITVDCVGTVRKVNAFNVGSFEDGDVKDYKPPRRFQPFDLLAGEGFPKVFLVTLILAETDMGGVSNFVAKLADEVAQMIAQQIADALAVGLEIVLGTLTGFIAAILGIILAYVLSKIVEWIIECWNDDIFPPFSQSIEIPSLSFNIDESVFGRAGFSGHGGAYQVWYSWKMFHA